MYDINNINLSSFILKDGSIRVESKDMFKIFEIIEFFFDNTIRNPDFNNAEWESLILSEIPTYEILFNKYIVLSSLRNEQKVFFDVMKKFDDPECTKSYSKDEIEKNRRSALSYYIEAKTKREQLEKELSGLE